MHKWISDVNLEEMERNTKIRELLGQELDSFVIKKSRLRWFEHVEHKGDTNW